MVDEYFRYLRDMSRKIAFRGGFDSCLLRHFSGINARYPKFYTVPNELKAQGYGPDSWMKSYAFEACRKDGNVGIYMGAGFMMGRVTLNGKSRTVAAPLVFCPIQAGGGDDDGDELSFEAYVSGVQINLDLMALLLAPEKQKEDQEGAQPSAPLNLIQAIKECEKLIEETDWEAANTTEKIWANLTQVSDRIEDILRSHCPAMGKFQHANWPGYRQSLSAIENPGQGYYFAVCGFFVGPAPSQVTTYGSLVQLIRENNAGGVAAKNSVLSGLLEGTLNNRPHDVQIDQETQQHVMHEVLPKVPLSLSDKQREAVAKAWSSDISYIQGPPGTGKSHTITAMLLAGILMGKRVLLVSNKKAALDVVREKMEKIIPGGGIAYAVRDESGRRVQRAELLELINRSTSPMYAAELYQLNHNKEAATKQIRRLQANVDLLESELGRYLEASKSAHAECARYISRRDNFCRQYEADALAPAKLDKFRTKDADVENAAKIREWHSRQLTTSGTAPIVEALRAKAFLAHCVNTLGHPHKPGTRPDYNQVNDYVDTLHAYGAYSDRRERIPENPDSIRRRLAEAQKQLDEVCTELICILLDIRKLEGAKENKQSLQRLSSILYFKNPKRLKDLMSGGGIKEAMEACPIWAAEIKDLSSVLPFEADMFDLVVVDEASQVNIPEIVPAFFRGQRFCVVGDEKQLGLSAAGFFAINTVFERLTWQRHINGLSYEEAISGGIVASRDSILDFIIKGLGGVHVPKITLNEHFRSKPLLAQFTSDKFYANEAEGGLRIMTQNGQSVGAKCFELRIVGGAREESADYVENEVTEALKIARSIANGPALASEPLASAGLPQRPSVGIVSFMRDQKDYLQLRTSDPEFSGISQKIDLLIGTPEEFQGNERDIMILTFGLGAGMERYSKQFFENPNRFNVATSRARHFTYAVIGACPANATLLREYFGRFGYSVSENPAGEPPTDRTESTGYRFAPLDTSKLESEFERLMLDELKDYAAARLAAGRSAVTLHNQVEACGQKRLDFVVLNTANKHCVAVEVDGPSHYCGDSRVLTTAHIERCGILRRAGWKIIHIEHHAWYKSGWLRKDSQLAEVRKKLHADLDSALS